MESGPHKIATPDVHRDVELYLEEVFAGLASARDPGGEAVVPDGDHEVLADAVFSVLTSRKFCYLSRKKVQCHRESVVASLQRRMATGEPFRFFYDIGPGYHATIRPGVLPIRYDVGLSELLVLYQISSLCKRIRDLYEPGARFWLVIDNVCALRTNDIAIRNTEEYARQLRALIRETGMSGLVDLIVESEVVDLQEYDRRLESTEAAEEIPNPDPQAIDNVARFLGRPCTAGEAAHRMALYCRTGAVTDELIGRFVRDVHMTQRATGATLGFRAFPGGDQRTQTGELVLIRGGKRGLRPMLLTSRNADAYACTAVHLPDLLPASISHVVYAEAVTPPSG